jgi:prolycopene isomerase
MVKFEFNQDGSVKNISQTNISANKSPEDSKLFMNKIYDYIVIGMGLSGLSCALKLTQKYPQKSILCLEQNDQVGGYAVNFKRKDFRFEVSLHYCGKPMKNSINELNLTDISLIECPIWKESIIKDKHYFYSWNHLEYQKTLSEQFPLEKENLERFFGENMAIAPFLAEFATKGGIKKFYYSLKNISKLMKVKDLVKLNAKELLDQYFQDQKLKTELFSLASYFGSTPEVLSAIIYIASVLNMFCQGSYYIKGGSEALTRSMANHIKQNNGTIELNAKVNEIIVINNQINTIKYVQNKISHEIKGKKIIFAGDIHNLMENIIHQTILDSKVNILQLTNINKKSIVEAIFEVWIGLDIALKDFNLPNYATEIETQSGKFYFTNYSNIDATCSPQGTSAITLLKITTIDKFEEAVKLDGNKRGKNYYHLKEEETKKMVDEFINVLKTYIPDIKNHIKVIESASPITMKRYTSNYRGSFGGFQPSHENMIKNPIPNETPIPNLFLLSQWVGFGAGYEMTIRNGLELAKKI